MSATSRLSIVLAGLLVNSSAFYSGPFSLSNETPRAVSNQIPRPVRRFPFNPRAAKINFLSFEFERAYLGREGPSFTKLIGEPSAGAQYLATAKLFGEEAITTAKFELVDQNGHVLQLLHFFKQDNSLENGSFIGYAKIPERPFRIVVSGMGVDGKPYRRVFERLFQPGKRPSASSILPRGLTPSEAKTIAAMLTEIEKQAVADLEKRASKRPDGVIVMPRIEILNVTHESFRSEHGNKLGMQLSYDIRFSTDGDYAHSLQVFPSYEDYETRGLIDMEVLSEEINPKPEPPSYATPDIHVDLNTLVKSGSEAWYKGGVVYHFTIKLVPDFVGQNVNKSKFCVDEEHYKSKVRSLQLWQRMKRDSRLIAYRIFMYGLAYGGETDPSDPPKVYYDGFLKEGAVRCLPYKNYNF